MEVSDDDLAAMRAAGPPREFDAEQPLVELVRELARRRDRGFVHVQKDGLSITLAKRDSA